MRSNRAKVRAGVSMAATLPMLAGALALGIPAAHAADSPGRDTLAGTKPAWATAKADKGAASNGAQVSARVYLAGRNAAGGRGEALRGRDGALHADRGNPAR